MIKDQTSPGEKWKFDEPVAVAFDDMLERSIPQYQLMRKLCFTVGSLFVREKTAVVDLGCSKGGALTEYLDKFGATIRCVGVDVSEPMIAAAREKFKGWIDCGTVEIKNLDLRTDYPPVAASLTLCVLTLQFTPIEHRQKIIRNAFKSTLPGGAMILVEKLMGASAETDAVLAKEYWRIKEENGYTKDQIDRKRLSLEGVLVPVTAKWNEDLLSAAGFRQIECFWRYLNFAAWLAIKE